MVVVVVVCVVYVFVEGGLTDKKFFSDNVE